jgi:hypothetical protein
MGLRNAGWEVVAGSSYVIVRDERHLLRLMHDYVSYHHQDRMHDSLEKRAIEQRPPRMPA